MKRLLIVTLALSLAGCAGESVLIGGPSLTAPITNPVTPKMLYDIESGARVAVNALVGYRRLCLAGKADTHCRANIEAIQPYTRQLCSVFEKGRCQVGLLADLRTFVKNNDQMNAINVFNAARNLLARVNQIRTGATS